MNTVKIIYLECLLNEGSNELTNLTTFLEMCLSGC